MSPGISETFVVMCLASGLLFVQDYAVLLLLPFSQNVCPKIVGTCPCWILSMFLDRGVPGSHILRDLFVMPGTKLKNRHAMPLRDQISLLLQPGLPAEVHTFFKSLCSSVAAD